MDDGLGLVIDHVVLDRSPVGHVDPFGENIVTVAVGEDFGDVAANEPAGTGQTDSHSRSLGRPGSGGPWWDWWGYQCNVPGAPFTGPVICKVIQPP